MPDYLSNGSYRNRKLSVAILAYFVFCGFGLPSRLILVFSPLFLLTGLAFPILRATISRDWTVVGFTTRNRCQLIWWVLGIGLLWGVFTFIIFREGALPQRLLDLRLAITIPIWLLTLSPFQEFFFRGWLRPRLEFKMEKVNGLVRTPLLFTFWHFLPIFDDNLTAIHPLSSYVRGFSTFLVGVVFGGLHQRTGKILAPWLAHALGGIALESIGRMTIIRFIP